jgi:DNA invertase Pin-like site-specific DNA recombinase
MLDRTYDPTQPYRYARYGRMSDPKQNKRSPDQQFNTIDETIARRNYPWRCVATYRDDGKSGRYFRKRKGFQRLLRDIEAELIEIDLVVVDTLERLGRSDEIAELRRKLFVEHGILIVAADTGLSDPTGVVGKAVGMVEQIRSTEHTRISRHNVIRGKKDAARLGHWPGGPPPFGFGLKGVVNEAVSPPKLYNVLELEPRQAAALRLAFERAAATGEGDQRLTRWWNANPEIPDDFKPISPFVMGYRLENPISIGTLRWGANRTGVVNDTRVIEPNPDGAELIPNFCAPLVSVELYERVLQLRRIRGDQIKNTRKAKKADSNGPTKLIAPQARGLTLKYLLSGLVRCGCCNASMRPVSSGRQSKAGRRYTYFTCPRHYDGACGNGRHVPEDRLRAAAIARLRARLFPPPEQAHQAPAWLPELVGRVRQEQQRFQADEPDRNAVDQEKLEQLGQQLAGWSMTLGKPHLPAVVRSDIEDRYAQGKQRQQDLLQSVAARKALQECLDRTLDPIAVATALHHLGEVLAGHNPTLGNLELSKHIEVITCYPDGRVEMRGTMLGLFEGAVELLSAGDNRESPAPKDTDLQTPVVPRRRGRLRVPNLSADGKGLAGDADTALDPERFTGLPVSFFWTEPILIEESCSWSEQHAAQVAQARAAGKTHEQLAALFDVSVPTIRKALRIATAADPSLQRLPNKLPRPRWPELHFLEVAGLRRRGSSLAELCRYFGRSEPLIRAALRLAEEHAVREGNEGPGPDDASAPNPPP